jgi:hypothetical protein
LPPERKFLPLPPATFFDGGCGLLFAVNDARLQKSLRLLRNVSEARLIRDKALIAKHEAILKQHDYDARDKIDPRQLSIFDTK